MKLLKVNGIDLATIDRGRGLPLMLVHGFPLDHTMWRAQIEALSEHCRVIAPDLRGFGRSGVTEGKVTMQQFADDLAALVHELEVEQPVVFCGLSMGGYVAWQFWQKYASRTRGLILCDTRATADRPQIAAERLKTARQVIREGPAPLVKAMIPKLFAEATARARPELIESLRRVILSTDPKGIAAAARGMAQRPDATGMLGRIDCPALVLVGEYDALSTPAQMQSVADAIPAARCVQIAGAGHMAPIENPKQVNQAILAFINDLRG